MHAQNLLHQFIKKVMPDMHSTRRAAVEAVAGAVTSGGVLAVTALGRNMRSSAME